MYNLNEKTKQLQKLTKKGKETRMRIVSAAAKLIFERGVAGTSVEDVQREAKISASQLYHYFKEKRELVLAVIMFQTEQVLSNQEPLLSQLDSLEALRAWCDAIIKLKTETNFQGGCPLGSLASELSDIDTEARLELANGFMQWETAIRKGLRAMYERGELRLDADPDGLALALLTALQGGLLLAQVRREISPLTQGLNVVISYIDSLVVKP